VVLDAGHCVNQQAVSNVSAICFLCDRYRRYPLRFSVGGSLLGRTVGALRRLPILYFTRSIVEPRIFPVVYPFTFHDVPRYRTILRSYLHAKGLYLLPPCVQVCDCWLLAVTSASPPATTTDIVLELQSCKSSEQTQIVAMSVPVKKPTAHCRCRCADSGAELLTVLQG
jgi:hypothetical protein